MPDTQPRRFQCRHIFTDGHRCGSPCLRGEEFCFYHHTARGHKAIPTVDLSQGEHQKSPFTLPSLEDRSAIQHAIGEVLNRLASNQLDPRRAGLLLYGLQIASLNLPQPAPAKPQPQATPVEEVIAHPDLGPIAPPTEILPPGADHQPTTLTELLLQELRRNAPHLPPNPTHLVQPIPPPEPTILTDLTAAEGSTTSEASTTATPPNRVISTEAKRSGETCGSHRHHRPVPNRVISTAAQRSGETCGSHRHTNAFSTVSSRPKRSAVERPAVPTAPADAHHQPRHVRAGNPRKMFAPPHSRNPGRPRDTVSH